MLVTHEGNTYFIKRDDVIIHSFDVVKDEDEQEGSIHVTFLHSKGVDYAIYNTSDDNFPENYLVNLMTGERKIIDGMSKGGISQIRYTEDFIIFTAYTLGQGHVINIINYEGDRVKISDIVGERYYDNSIDGITVKDNQLLFNILIDSELLNGASHLIDFDTSNFVMKTYDYYSTPKTVAIIPYFLYPSCQQIIDDDNLTKILSFMTEGNHYLKAKEAKEKFVEKDHMFKNLYDMNEVSEPLFTFTKSLIDTTLLDIKNVKDLKEDDICDMTCQGLYSGRECNLNWLWFMQIIFNAETFREELAKMALGYEYLTGSVSKSLFPHGIGLKFVISTSDISYEYVIKMSLHELEDNTDRVTYDKDKSKLDISLRVYHV
jgi:hypothetical protein